MADRQERQTRRILGLLRWGKRSSSTADLLRRGGRAFGSELLLRCLHDAMDRGWVERRPVKTPREEKAGIAYRGIRPGRPMTWTSRYRWQLTEAGREAVGVGCG